MKTPAFLTAFLLLAAPLAAQVPNLIPHQGRVAVNGVNFDGTGQFKFALVNATGTTTYWSNNGSSTAGSQPTASVPLPVTKGLYSALLGDTSLANMTAVPASVYTNTDLRLRVWFNNGTLGFQQLSPDQRLAPNGYLPDGAVTAAKLAPGAAAPAVKVTGETQNVVPNTNYIATGSGTTAFTLPASATNGDVVNISGAGSGGLSVFNPDEWTARGEAKKWVSIASPADGAKLVAAWYSSNAQNVEVIGIYTSADSGLTWVPRATMEAWSLASSADGSCLVAGVSGGQLWISGDSGQTWSLREQSRDWRCVAMSADGSRIIAADYLGRIYTSMDYGTTWAPREQSRAWRGVASSADGTKFVAAVSPGRLYTSSDSGATWTPREQDREWLDVASSADGTRLIAAAAVSGLYISTDSGVTWTPREQMRIWRSVASSTDGLKLFAAEFYGRLYVSRDAGVSWSLRAESKNWLDVASSAEGNKLFAVNWGDRLYASGTVLPATGAQTAAFTYGSDGWRLNTPSGLWTRADGNVYRASGNVGIGESNPATALHVNGVITGDGTGLTNLRAASLTGSVPARALSSVPSASLTGSLPLATLPPDIARRAGGNGFTGTQTITGGGRVGIGTTNPATLLQLGDKSVTNSQGLMRLASASPSGTSWREWEVGVPGGTENITGKTTPSLLMTCWQAAAGRRSWCASTAAMSASARKTRRPSCMSIPRTTRP